MIRVNKKGDGLVAIVIILIVIIFLGWLINLGSRECNSNKDCKGDGYCGSDFACHKFPIIEKTTTLTQVSYTTPILLICITIIVLSIIWRWEKIFVRKTIKSNTETSEAYYNSQVEQSTK